MFSYLCNVCDLGFITGKELVLHVDRIHHPSKQKFNIDNLMINTFNKVDLFLKSNILNFFISKINVTSN